MVFGDALPTNIPCCSLSCCCSTWVVAMQKSGLVLLFLNVPEFSLATRPCFHPRSFSSKRQLIFLLSKCVLIHLIFAVEPHLRILKCFEAIRSAVFSTAEYDKYYDSRIFQISEVAVVRNAYFGFWSRSSLAEIQAFLFYGTELELSF